MDARGIAVAALLSFVACSRPTPSQTPQSSAIELIRATSRGHVLLARLVAGAPGGGWSSASTPLRITPAGSANAATRIAIDEHTWIEVRAIDDAPSPLQGDARLRQATGVRHGVDVVHVVEATRFEELRVLRDREAPRAARYELRWGPNVAKVRMNGDRVEVVDRLGHVRLASEMPWATDAAGKDAPLSIRLEQQDDHALLETSVAEGAWSYPIVVDPGWTKVGGTLTAQRPTAAFELTAGGKALIVGLGDSTNDLYDPTTGYVFAATPRSSGARTGGTVVRSGSGRIYVVGATGISTVERYDSAAGTWSYVADLPDIVYSMGAFPVGSNKLLVAGGYAAGGASGVSAKSYLFDESTGAWTTVGNLAASRAYSASAVLADGRPILIGGSDSSSAAVSLVEIFDPTSKTWSLAKSANRTRAYGSAITLKTGKVLLVGGSNDTSGSFTEVSTSEIYDPSTNTWTDVPTGGPASNISSLIGGSSGLVVLGTGRVLYAGNDSTGCSVSSWLYDPAKPASGWIKGPDTPGTGVCEEIPTLLASGKALYSGAYAGYPLTWSEPVATGTTCATDFDCASGHCVDGACCDTACTNPCEACNVSGKVGTCTPVPAGKPTGARTCPGDTGCAGTCDGTSSLCVLPAKGTECKAANCAGTTFTPASTCDDKGACVAPTSATGCAPYACDATGCKTSCASDTDCAPGLACRRNVCEGAVLDAGSTDATADGAAPALPEKPVVGEIQRCEKDSECSTGHCVEGVCCDTACEDRCHSCALLTSPGKCTLEPVGVDLKSDCGASFTCTGTCDGTGQCIGAGKGTMCARNHCTSTDRGVGAAYCPGPGAKCDDDGVVPFECAPYACEPAFGACLTTCKASSDCANGFVCDLGSRSCVAPPPAEADSGCAFDPRPSHAAGTVLALLGLSLATRRRRNAAN